MENVKKGGDYLSSRNVPSGLIGMCGELNFYPVILIVRMDVHSFPRLPFQDDLLSFRSSFKVAFMVRSERFTFV